MIEQRVDDAFKHISTYLTASGVTYEEAEEIAKRITDRIEIDRRLYYKED